MLGGKATSTLQVSRNTRPRDIPRRRVKQRERERERERGQKPSARRKKSRSVKRGRARPVCTLERFRSPWNEVFARRIFRPRGGVGGEASANIDFQLPYSWLRAMSLCRRSERVQPRQPWHKRNHNLKVHLSVAACSTIDLRARFSRLEARARLHARRAFPRPRSRPDRSEGLLDSHVWENLRGRIAWPWLHRYVWSFL